MQRRSWGVHEIMTVDNNEIADIFDYHAALLELTDANPFRVRAYHNAARMIQALPQSIESMIAEGKELTELPSIGNDLAAKIREIVSTGSFADMRRLQSKLPGGLIQMETIAGLGPKRVKILYEKLGVSDITSLLRACRSGKVAGIKGFGEKTEARILAACEEFHPEETRFKLAVAEQIAVPLLSYLRKAPGVEQAIIAGSYRRCRETVGDLDVLVIGRDASRIMNYFTAYEDIVSILSKGSTRSTVRLRVGIQVDVRVVPQESYGAALLYFTGSKPHNIVLRTLATERKLKINEYGVFKGSKNIAGRTEEEIYRLLGLSYIEPELRENNGEIEAAREGRLPELITPEDIRGDLHAHTKATDGANTLEEMAEAAKKLGYEYLAVTDHTRHVTVAHGQNASQVLQQCRMIDELNAQLKGITILKSAEVDILEDGTLDLPDSVLRQLDLTVCSIHYKFGIAREKQTERMIRAMDNPYVNIIAHPTGRLVGSRKSYDIDMERVMRVAKERGCFLELNAFPDRLDLNDIHCRMAKEIGLKVVISTDSHHTSHLKYMRYGVAQARRGWLEADDVLNTRDLVTLRKLLKRK